MACFVWRWAPIQLQSRMPGTSARFVFEHPQQLYALPTPQILSHFGLTACFLLAVLRFNCADLVHDVPGSTYVHAHRKEVVLEVCPEEVVFQQVSVRLEHRGRGRGGDRGRRSRVSQLGVPWTIVLFVGRRSGLPPVPVVSLAMQCSGHCRWCRLMQTKPLEPVLQGSR